MTDQNITDGIIQKPDKKLSCSSARVKISDSDGTNMHASIRTFKLQQPLNDMALD
jgi:hypothetical protein